MMLKNAIESDLFYNVEEGDIAALPLLGIGVASTLFIFHGLNLAAKVLVLGCVYSVGHSALGYEDTVVVLIAKSVVFSVVPSVILFSGGSTISIIHGGIIVYAILTLFRIVEEYRGNTQSGVIVEVGVLLLLSTLLSLGYNFAILLSLGIGFLIAYNVEYSPLNISDTVPILILSTFVVTEIYFQNAAIALLVTMVSVALTRPYFTRKSRMVSGVASVLVNSGQYAAGCLLLVPVSVGLSSPAALAAVALVANINVSLMQKGW